MRVALTEDHPAGPLRRGDVATTCRAASQSARWQLVPACRGWGGVRLRIGLGLRTGIGEGGRGFSVAAFSLGREAEQSTRDACAPPKRLVAIFIGAKLSFQIFPFWPF